MKNDSKDVFINYLNKFLSLYFIHYPKHYVSGLFPFYLEIKDILNFDVQCKYPRIDLRTFSKSDLFNLFQIDAALEAVFYYRLERSIFLREPEHPLLPFLANLMRMKSGIEFYYSTEVGPGLNIQHGVGVVVGPRCKIGKNFVIHQGVSIGQKNIHSPNDSVTIGDEVVVFSGAKIIGNLKIGDYAQIGANAVVRDDVESHSVYVGIPAKKIRSNRDQIKS